MTIDRLDPTRGAELRAQACTYSEVGASTGAAPPGYGHFSRARTVRSSRDFDAIADDVLSWRVQERAGLRVAASERVLELGTVVELRFGPGPLSVRIPCRVVYVVAEPDRRGFAYGTLPGHPECGEESFVVTRRPDGRVDFTVTAFSRPATTLARLGGPATTLVQRAMTRRYLRALDD